MGQRLDRPSNSGGTTSNHPSTGNANQVATSMSTTFSSSSSTSSTSSNNGAPPATNVPSTTNLVNVPRTTASNSSGGGGGGHSRHHHRHRHTRSRGSVTQNNNSETPTNEMSPRTRFRSEMARRGYTNSSSDLFFRLFQFPPPQATSSTADPATSNILPLPATPPTNNSDTTSTAVAQSAPTSASAGLSAFRFFNLGGGGSSAITSGGDLDSDLTSDEDEPERWNHNMSSLAQSLPFFFGVRDFKCFVCSKQIPADDVEAHIMMCLTKPKLTYNDDILNDNKGECIICFEELEKGQTIARLQCLCIYHKHCIENWLQRSQSCPGHPPD